MGQATYLHGCRVDFIFSAKSGNIFTHPLRANCYAFARWWWTRSTTVSSSANYRWWRLCGKSHKSLTERRDWVSFPVMLYQGIVLIITALCFLFPSAGKSLHLGSKHESNMTHQGNGLAGFSTNPNDTMRTSTVVNNSKAERLMNIPYNIAPDSGEYLTDKQVQVAYKCWVAVRRKDLHIIAF